MVLFPTELQHKQVVKVMGSAVKALPWQQFPVHLSEKQSQVGLLPQPYLTRLFGSANEIFVEEANV